jgi:hypothetical protein
MIKKFGLRFRINFVITLVVVIFALAASDVLIEETRRSIREEIEAGTKVTVQLMETVIANTRATAQSGPHNQALLSFLRHVGRVRANEIKMYDENDQLIYTSPPSLYKQGRWAPDWFHRLADPKIGEFRLNLPNGTVVITSDPSRSILDAWDDLKNFSGWCWDSSCWSTCWCSGCWAGRCGQSAKFSAVCLKWRMAASTRGCRNSNFPNSTRSATPSIAWRRISRKALRKTSGWRWSRSNPATPSSSMTSKAGFRSGTRRRAACSAIATMKSSAVPPLAGRAGTSG